MEQTSFCAAIAGKTLRINTPVAYMKERFGEYLTDSEAEICIDITQTDIDREYAASVIAGNTGSSKEELAMLAIGRKTAEALLTYSTFLMHGAVIAVGDSAFMFTARSGVGKTTHIQKWMENLPEAYVVNGDKPLIRADQNGATVYGSPWCGKEHLNKNVSVPLRAIALMERGEDNRIEEITFSQAFPTLLQQTYRPTDAEKMRKTLSLLTSLNGKVKFFRFVFNNLKDDAFRTAYDALVGNK